MVEEDPKDSESPEEAQNDGLEQQDFDMPENDGGADPQSGASEPGDAELDAPEQGDAEPGESPWLPVDRAHSEGESDAAADHEYSAPVVEHIDPESTKGVNRATVMYESELNNTFINEIESSVAKSQQSLDERHRGANGGKRTVIVAIICGIVGVAILAFAGVALVRALTPKATTSYEEMVVERGNLSETVQATGTLRADSQVAVVAETSGVVNEVKVSEGQKVQQGEVLFTLKNTELEKSLSQIDKRLEKAEADLDAANKEASSAQQAYEKARDDHDTAYSSAVKANDEAKKAAQKAYDDMYETSTQSIPSTTQGTERERLVTQAVQKATAAYNEALAARRVQEPAAFDGSTYLAAVELANSKVTAAKKAYDDAQKEHDTAEAQLEKTTIKAPTAGTFLDVKVKEGDKVEMPEGEASEDKNPVLAYVADVSRFNVAFDVEEAAAAYVQTDSTTSLEFPSAPGLTAEAKVRAVAPANSQADGKTTASSGSSSGTSSSESSASSGASASSGSSASKGAGAYRVVAVVRDPDSRLKPGMEATANIVIKDVPDVLVVPVSALIEEEGETHVKVVTDKKTSKVTSRRVVLGERGHSEVAVKSGLNEGETIILNPDQYVEEKESSK